MNQQALQPSLDPTFLPAEAVLRSLEYAAKQHPECTERLAITLAGAAQAGAAQAGAGNIWRFQLQLPFRDASLKPTCILAGERIFKTMLWLFGGQHAWVDAPQDLLSALQERYQTGGDRAFDADFMGHQIYEAPFQVEGCALEDHPQPQQNPQQLGGHWRGCRIGFDLGGSERKLAAVIDGNVVHAEEVVWDPYFQDDPTYHVEGIRDCIERAAAHLPRIDAIGGSAAGIYVDNLVRVGSLFRGIPSEPFQAQIRPLFQKLQDHFKVPFAVINDGDVTALAGAMTMQKRGLLGIAMGTSQAGGFVDHAGNITGALNELAFAPIDWHPDAPRDEWSGDAGVGALYFSQQAVGRLATKAGLTLDASLPLPQQLVAVQKLAEQGDARALQIFETIGDYLAWTLPYYHRFYQNQHVLLLGRVTSGAGGEHLVTRTRSSLKVVAPGLAETLGIHVPDERTKRLGQAVAAASLPKAN